MKDLCIIVPAHIQRELEETAERLGVSLEALIAYFFGCEVVHT